MVLVGSYLADIYGRRRVLLAAVLFVLGLRWLGSPTTAEALVSPSATPIRTAAAAAISSDRRNRPAGSARASRSPAPTSRPSRPSRRSA